MAIQQVPATADGGSMLTATRRVVWHTSEGDTFSGLLSTLRTTRYWPHYSWDPRTGEIAQHLSHDRAGRALVNSPGGCETNRWGALQVEVVGRAATPFTNASDLRGLDELMVRFRAAGVPDRFPAGSPLPYPASYGLHNPQRSISTWLGFPGHYGHSQVPENEHGDPGAIDIRKILGVTPPTIVQEPDDMPLTAEDVEKVVDGLWRDDPNHPGQHVGRIAEAMHTIYPGIAEAVVAELKAQHII